jgi:hypothetical protein
MLQWKNAVPAELRLQNLQGRMLWKKTVMPGQSVALPRFKGFQILVSNGKMLDKWVGF